METPELAQIAQKAKERLELAKQSTDRLKQLREPAKAYHCKNCKQACPKGTGFYLAYLYNTKSRSYWCSYSCFQEFMKKVESFL